MMVLIKIVKLREIVKIRSRHNLNPCDTYTNVYTQQQWQNIRPKGSMSSSETSANLAETVWQPSIIVDSSATVKHALVVLNREISLSASVVFQLWRTAKVKITVDGGTDQWYRFIFRETQCSMESMNTTYFPDLITGDFDSILPETLRKAKNDRLNVIETPDQNETDYTKALRQLKRHCDINNIELDCIYVICDTTGRLDHIMANVNTLYKCQVFLKNIQVIQIASDSFTWLLSPGKHKIQIPDALIAEKAWCGLIPIGSSDNCISTTGLKWNLDKRRLKFGELVSTSNTYTGKEVTVDTNDHIIWTMGIEPLVSRYDVKKSQLCAIV